MLPQGSPNPQSDCDQPATDSDRDSMKIDVATNCDAGTTEVDESEEDERCGPDIWDDDDDDDDDDERYYDFGLEESWDDEEDVEDESCGSEVRDDDDNEDLDKNSENEDSDCGSSRQDAPKKKRAKTTQSVAASPSRKNDNLSLLPTMPLDILFEIFNHLYPEDIASLSRISKMFHETLSSRTMLSVWKAARERVSAPDGPDWMSEAAWVDLLFGHNCQSCGKKDIQTVDFLLLKRICISCKKRHYLLRSRVDRCYLDFDFAILGLVPSTNVSARGSWDPSGLRYYYWDLDLYSMVSKVAALKEAADAQQLNCFMEERKRRLQCIRQHSHPWAAWYAFLQKSRASERKRAEERRLQQIKEKFKELGYIDEDLLVLRSRDECRGTAQLSAKNWTRICPILEPEVQKQKAERLERELEEIKRRRRQVLATRYKDYKRTLDPLQWKYLPRVLDIAVLEAFSQHIEAEVGVEVDETTFDDAFLELPNLLASATEEHRATLGALIGDTPREDGEIGPDPIDLATAVFKCAEAPKCPHFKYLFGWDEIASHHCLPETEGINHGSGLRRAPAAGLQYTPNIVIVVRKLAQLTRLDASTATAADFDEKDARFNCDACYSFKGDQNLQVGYTWRNLAVHLEKWKTHNLKLNITVLSDGQKNEVKQCERNDRKWKAKQWTCSHCPEFIDNLQHREDVVQHLSDSHGIQTPSEPTDYFFFERCRREWAAKPKFLAPVPKKPAPSPQSNNSQKNVSGKFQCLVCVSNRDRRFILKGVEDHLRAKHGISSGQHGVHYKGSK